MRRCDWLNHHLVTVRQRFPTLLLVLLLLLLLLMLVVYGMTALLHQRQWLRHSRVVRCHQDARWRLRWGAAGLCFIVAGLKWRELLQGGQDVQIYCRSWPPITTGGIWCCGITVDCVRGSSTCRQGSLQLCAQRLSWTASLRSHFPHKAVTASDHRRRPEKVRGPAVDRVFCITE